MNRRVRFSKRSESDFLSIYDYIARKSGTEIAIGYVKRIREYCLTFQTFPQRGTPWGNVLSNMRVVGFERRVSIAFHVTSNTVTILRVLYGGRDLKQALK